MSKKVWLATQFADGKICTKELQALIDECHLNGGGQIRFTAGTYLTGTLVLKSHVSLYLDAGAVLRGSSDYMDYHSECGKQSSLHSRWHDSLICAVDQQDISISGHGIIDGVDCYNPTGEQQFRGPHTIFFYRCSHFVVEGITIIRSACYSMMFDECSQALLSDLYICGGQDGVRLVRCNEFEVIRCDFRTGDDCVSGPYNQNLKFIDCSFNTPGGSTFLIGCCNLHVKGCKLWGQGEYPAVFKECKRYSNSLTGFSMLYDYDASGEAVFYSDNWLIEDVVLENIETIFRYDRSSNINDGPLGNVTINGILAANYIYPVMINGKGNKSIRFTIRRGIFIRCKDDNKTDRGFLRANAFDEIILDDIEIWNSAEENLMSFEQGNRVSIHDVRMVRSVQEKQITYASIENKTIEDKEVVTAGNRFVVHHTDSISVPKDETEDFRGALKYIR